MPTALQEATVFSAPRNTRSAIRFRGTSNSDEGLKPHSDLRRDRDACRTVSYAEDRQRKYLVRPSPIDSRAKGPRNKSSCTCPVRRRFRPRRYRATLTLRWCNSARMKRATLNCYPLSHAQRSFLFEASISPTKHVPSMKSLSVLLCI